VVCRVRCDPWRRTRRCSRGKGGCSGPARRRPLGKRGIGAARAGPRALRALGDTALEQSRSSGLGVRWASMTSRQSLRLAFSPLCVPLRRGSARRRSRGCTTPRLVPAPGEVSDRHSPKGVDERHSGRPACLRAADLARGPSRKVDQSGDFERTLEGPATMIRRRVRGSSSFHFLLTTTAPVLPRHPTQAAVTSIRRWTRRPGRRTATTVSLALRVRERRRGWRARSGLEREDVSAVRVDERLYPVDVVHKPLA
jgi:hypothetical protein